MATICCMAVAIATLAAPAGEKVEMKDKGIKIMVISDPHLLALALHDDGAAARHLAESDMKLVLESDMIMERMVDEIINEHAQLLLITGDLTFNGARASHERLVTHLERLRQAGVRSLVIPGNHDVRCPYSKQYLGDSTEPVATVSSEEFARLYSSCGYGDDAERDPNSLSYTCEPIPGLMMLCIDSNRYSENRLPGDEGGIEYHNDGAIKPESMEWIKHQLAVAQSQGKRVIALMHHHLLEHIDGESKLLPNYIVAGHEQVAQVLRDGGVKVVFTGHLHITDAVTMSGLSDVAIGSASTYPLPMRTVTVSPAIDSLSIDTHFFSGIDSVLLNHGRCKVEKSVSSISSLIARRLWSKLSGRAEKLTQMLAMQGMEAKGMPHDARELSELLLRHLREPLTQSMLSVASGGEDPQQAVAIINAIKQGVRGMIVEIIPDGGELMADFLLEELLPRVEPTLRSALEDLNRVGDTDESHTDDHRLVIGW